MSHYPIDIHNFNSVMAYVLHTEQMPSPSAGQPQVHQERPLHVAGSATALFNRILFSSENSLPTKLLTQVEPQEIKKIKASAIQRMLTPENREATAKRLVKAYLESTDQEVRFELRNLYDKIFSVPLHPQAHRAPSASHRRAAPVSPESRQRKHSQPARSTTMPSITQQFTREEIERQHAPQRGLHVVSEGNEVAAVISQIQHNIQEIQTCLSRGDIGRADRCLSAAMNYFNSLDVADMATQDGQRMRAQLSYLDNALGIEQSIQAQIGGVPTPAQREELLPSAERSLRAVHEIPRVLERAKAARSRGDVETEIRAVQEAVTLMGDIILRTQKEAAMRLIHEIRT